MALSAATADYETTLDELARYIRKRRPKCPPRETARQILEYDRPGHISVVGIDSRAKRVVLFHERDRYAISVAFDGDGLAGGGPEIADLRSDPGLVRWIRKMGVYWDWVNPRYQ